jgi:hypothetical protein
MQPLDPAYDEDRKLVEIRTVRSLADAFHLQQLMDRAGIPFYMGPEKATGVDSVTSDFASGMGCQEGMSEAVRGRIEINIFGFARRPCLAKLRPDEDGAR